MKNNITKLFILCLFLAAKWADAQTLIPYLGKNGLYGYADENGKVVIKPDYDQAGFFGTNMFSNVKKNGEKMLIFRDGTVVNIGDANLYQSEVDHPLNTVTIPESAKSRNVEMADLILFITNKIHLVNTKLHKSVSYPKIIYGETQTYTLNSDFLGSYSGFAFKNGLIKVKKGANKYNFINESLDEIFKTDLYEGEVGLNNYIMIVDENLKQGIAKSDGTILLQPIYYGIVPLPKDGYFKIKKENANEWAIIDSNGKMLSDTIYEQIKTYKNYFLGIKPNKYEGQLFDYQGNANPELTNCSIDEQEINGFTIIKQDDKTNIYDAKLQKQLKDDYAFIWLAKINTDNQIPKEMKVGETFFIAKRNQKNESKLLNVNLKPFFTSSKYESIEPNLNNYMDNEFQTAGLRVEIYNNITRRPNYGIIGFNGKELVPAEYTTVWDYLTYLTKKPIFKYYAVSKDTLNGLYSYAGKAVLPCIYSDITVSIVENDTILLAKKSKKSLADIFDSKGKQILNPSFEMQKRKYSLENQNVSYEKIITEYLSDTLKKVNIISTKQGIFNIITDTNGKNIIPDGHVVLTKMFDYDYGHSTFLIPVIKGKITENLNTEKNTEKNIGTKNSPPDVSVIFDNTPATIEERRAMMKRSSDIEKKRSEQYDESQIGLVDFNGKWVVPVQKVIEYRASQKIPNIVIGVRFKDCYQCADQNKYIIHKINSPNETPFLAKDFGADKKYLYVQKFIAKVKGKDSTQTVYFNKAGKEISFKKIPNFRPFSNETYVANQLDNKGQIYFLIFDKNEKILFDSSEYKLAYGELNNCLLVIKDNFFGAIDTLGNVMIPMKYTQLNPVIVANKAAFFVGENEDNTFDLLYNNGKLIVKIENTKSEIRKLSSYKNLLNHNFCLIFNSEKGMQNNIFVKENQGIVNTIEGNLLEERERNLPENLVQIQQNNSSFYYDYIKNIEFRE